MPLTRQQIVEEVSKWDAVARSKLLDDLRSTLDDRFAEVSPQELAIYQRRLDELRGGHAETMSLDEVILQTLDRLKREVANP